MFFREEDGSCPTLDWLDSLPPTAKAKCTSKLERLAELGYELRRPEADVLRDKIHELRASYQGRHYRLLYFFHGSIAAIVSHGVVKERDVPPIEIDRAIARKRKFELKPEKHGYQEIRQ